MFTMKKTSKSRYIYRPVTWMLWGLDKLRLLFSVDGLVDVFFSFSIWGDLLGFNSWDVLLVLDVHWIITPI